MQEIEQIYTQYRQDVYRYLCSLTRDAALAEDLLSEMFLRALTGLSGFRKGACVRTWLFSIARHVWIDGLRRKRHKGLCHPRPAGKPYQDGGNVHRAELQHDRRHDEQRPVYGGTGSKGKSRGTDFPFGCGRGSQGGGQKAQANAQDNTKTKETVHPGAACRRQGGTEKEAPGAGKIKRNGGMRNVFHRGRRKPDLSVPQR